MTREPTEMEMKVAKAIRACEENEKTGPLATYEELARAAIRAMHTPTTEMLREVAMGAPCSTEDIAFIWETMIDAASSEEE